MLKTSTYQSKELTSKLYLSSPHNAAYGKRDRSPFRLSQDQNHMTVPYESLYQGLCFIFPGFYILYDPQFVLEVPFVEAFYEKQSGLYGIAFTPPERLMEMLGNYFLCDANDYHQSKEFFEFNTKHYPHSSSAFECLAKAYEAMGDTVNANLNFEKALELKR